jgi:hypothetical protein
MKHILIVLVFILGFNVYSQDKIVLKTGEELIVKFTEINDTEIKYKKLSMLNGPDFSISTSDIFMLVFENGEKMVMKETAVKEKELPTSTVFQDSKILVTMVDAISSDQKKGRRVMVGEIIDLKVYEDFKDAEGNVLVKINQSVVGTITVAENRKALGKKGELAFRVDNIKGVDGTQIPVKLIFNSLGKDKSVVAIGGAILLLPLALIKGKPAYVPSGTVFNALVKADTKIKINN